MKKFIKPTIIIIATLLIMSVIYSIGEYCGYRAHVLNTPLDDAIPYLNYFIYFYVSWYLLLFIFPLLVYHYDKKSFYKYISSVIVSLGFTLIIFIVYPTIMTRYDLPVESFNDRFVQLIYSISSPTKCVPSLHVIFAFSFIMPIFRNKEFPNKYKFFYYFFSIGIILSTLFIKQHLVYDAISAIIVVLISWWIVNRFKLEDVLIKKINEIRCLNERRNI